MLDSVGLVQMNGRVYNPVVGKFISADPMQDCGLGTQGWNRYAYVGNRALSATDPTGYDICVLGSFTYLTFFPRFSVSFGVGGIQLSLVEDIQERHINFYICYPDDWVEPEPEATPAPAPAPPAAPSPEPTGDDEPMGLLDFLRCPYYTEKVAAANRACRDELGDSFDSEIRFMQKYQAPTISDALLRCTCSRVSPETCTKWLDRKSTRLNSSHGGISRMPSSA